MAKKKKTYEDILREIKEARNLDTEKESASFQEYVEKNRPIEAPIRSDLGTQEEERTWFKSGHFSDGYDFGDVTRTVLGTGADLLENVSAGILGMGEKAVDTLAYLAPAFTMGQQVQNGGAFDIEQYRELQGWSKELIEKDLYDEEKIAKNLITDPAKKIGIDAEKGSVFGEKSDSLAQSAGQLAATALMSPVVPWWLTTGVTSFGSEAENALGEGASYEAAGGSALISAAAETLTEKLSGGIKFGGKTLDDVYIKPLTEKITNKTVKALTNVGIDAAGEGGEEVLSQVISNLGTSLYKEESIGELIASEEALDGYIESFIGGAVLGGGVSGVRAIKDAKAEKKAESMLTDNEQTLVNTEISNRTAAVQKQKTVADRIKSVIEEQERTFGSLTETEKKNLQQRVQSQLDSGELDYTKTELDKKELAIIEKEVREDLKRGYIGIDTIESTFSAEKTAQIKELEQSLINVTDDAKKAEIEAKIGQLKVDRAKELTGKFTNDNYLQESYRQEALKKQVFEYEVSESDSEITKELVESAKNTKMNNTRKMHELFDYTNKIANDTGTKYGFVNNEQLKQLGHDVEGKTVNGLVRVNKDGSSKILINIDSDKALNTIIGHETTHLLEGTSEYKALQEIVKEYATTKGEYDSRLKQIQRLYEGVDANVENEVTADLVGDYLFTDEQFINNLSTKQPSVFQKVYDYIKHVYKMATAGSKEARQLEQVKRKFDQAYKELSKTTTDKADSNLTTEADSNTNVVKFSLKNKNITKDTKIPYVENQNYINVSKNDNVTLEKLREEVRKLKRGTYENKATGYKADIKRETIGKIITPKPGKFNPWVGNYIENLNAAVKLPELFEKAVYIDSKPPQKAKNTGKQIKDYHHFVAPIRMDGKDYRVMITAREKQNSDTLYIVKTELMQIKRGSQTGGQKPTVSFGNPLDISIPDLVNGVNIYDYATQQNVTYSDADIRFSLSAPVEENKNLMALHNLRTDEVLKQLDWGGMPMPSVAVTDPSLVDHEGFGDVTLILDKDAIDPKKSKYNKVYSGDAYTPTFPPISYKANEVAAKNIENRVRAVFDDIPDYYRRGLASFRDIDNINHALNSAGGEQGLIERYKDTHDLKQLYLAEKGEVVPVVVEEIREEMDPFKVDSAKAVIEALGEDTVRELIPKTRGPHNIAIQKEWADKHQEELKEVYTNLFIKDGFSKEEAKGIVDEQKISFWLVEGKKAAEYLQTGGVTVKRKEDFTATNSKIDSLIPEEDYQRWVKELFTGIEGISGIRNKKDTFTPAGNRRSFEALHDPITLENIVKAMRGDELQKGQAALGGNLSGASAREYKSIKDIKNDSQRLGKLTKEEHDANNQYISDTLNEIAQRYANGKDWWDARNTLVEAVAQRETKTGIKSYLKQYDYVYKTDDFIVDDLIELRDYIRNLPVPYFEAKPQRAVGFDEVGVFVIPNNADAALKRKLLEAGYSIAEYNPDIEGDRQNVVNQFEKYKFSLSKQGDIAPVNGYAVYGSDVKVQEDIAPVKAAAAPTDIAPVKTPVVEEDLQLSRALTEEDLPYVEQDRDNAFNNLPDYVPEEIEYYNEADTTPLDDAYLRLIAKNMRSELGLKGNQLAGLRKIIQDFSTSDEQNIATLYDAIESEFGTIQEPKKLAEVAEIKDALRTMRIKVSDVIKGDIPDYAKWKQKQFGKIRIANDGLDVDDVYEGLKDVYPGFFPDDIINPTDQLLRIAEVAGMDSKYMEEYLIPEEDLQEVTDYIYEAITDFKQQRRLDAAREASKAPIDESMIPFEETVLETPMPEEATPVKKEEAPEDPDEAPLIAKTRKDLRKALIEDNKDVILNALDNAKNINSLLMNNTDTMRVSEMVFGREAGRKINELIFQKVSDNEAKSIKWQNQQRNDIKKLGIKPRSKESAAVQKWGEGEYIDDAGDLVKYTDSDLMMEFPDVATQKKIKDAARIIRSKYDEYIEHSNEVLTGLGFPPIAKRKDYFMHFQELGDFFSKNGIPFNPQNMKENNLPTDINGLTEFFVPQKKFFANMRRREGKRTVYDAVTGIDKYISSVADLIYHTEDIQRGRAFEELIRDTYGQGDIANANRELLPEELRADRLQKQKDNHLSKYVRWLHNWTDNLAGKKNRLDRAIEDFADRVGFSFLDTARRQVSANMIGFNVASSLTNLIAPVQAMAKTDKVAVAKGTADTIRNIAQKDDFAEKNTFLINRFGTDMLSKTWWQKAQDAGFMFMKGMDWFSSNQIVRSKFYELTSKGMSEEQAHEEAGKFAARILGDRTKGANAMLYNSKLFNTIGQFQLEVNNQLYSIFYDTYQESSEKAKGDALKTAAGMTFTLGQLFAFTHLFAETFKSVAGYNPTLDVFGIIATALGLGDDDDDDVVENLQQAADELLSALPYSSLWKDGGRIPLSNALPNIPGLITGAKGDYGEELDWKKEMNKLPYLLLPVGYSQIKKTAQGLGMFDSDLPVSGSYTDSSNLRFPVEDTPLNRLQAGIFGQYASANARDYFDNERQPLKEKQIQEYKDLDLPIAEYWKYREGLKEQDTVEEKFNYIAGLDLPVDKKNIMINNAVDRKDPVDLINYNDFGSYEEFDFATKYPEKYEFLEGIGVSYSEYRASEESKEAYNWAFNNPEKYTVAKAAAKDVVTYRSYAADLNDITADKDSSGKTISGSRKTKVANYINSLDAEYGSKLILFKSEYPADDRYNYEIIEYLNNRQDISYGEMATILTELGFVVDANGNVRW